MTTDAIGGVWQYSLALARGLVGQQHCSVMLVCLGEPRREDLAEASATHGTELVTLPLRLEWMPDSARDVAVAIDRVDRLAQLWKPDLIHSNQFCFGLLTTRKARVVVAHSDVLSWRKWHLQQRAETRAPASPRQPEPDPALRAYRDLVAAGLAGASAVVCPSHFMARSLLEIYSRPSLVIHNGLWPDLYPSRPKKAMALLAGRLWDEGKGAATAVRAMEGLPMELDLLGPTVGPSGEATCLPSAPNVRYLGARSWSATRETMAEAQIYLATSRYEPFGLAALEAAFCGCALVAADTPSYREVWGSAAVYFPPGDASALRHRVTELINNPLLAERMGSVARTRALELYTADRMAQCYWDLYNALQ
jgi:glycosyltransferase involved in cell wall biosynthesis